jgi:hypothetical protein
MVTAKGGWGKRKLTGAHRVSGMANGENASP